MAMKNADLDDWRHIPELWDNGAMGDRYYTSDQKKNTILENETRILFYRL